MVYFITCSTETAVYVKIGYTNKSVKDRLASLQCGCPLHLKAVVAFEGNRLDERAMHQRFRKSNLWGEWFILSDEILEFLHSAFRVEILERVETVLSDSELMKKYIEKMGWDEKQVRESLELLCLSATNSSDSSMNT